MISVVLAASIGWVTISQSRHGAQLNTIKSQMAGEQLDYGPMVQQTLGYLWDLPASSTSTRGLGGGITWAWDPVLCDDLQPQFREDFFFIEYISCRDLKAAMHRGFSSWSANHPHIHFVEVTTECEHLDKERGGEGKAWKECPLVEIWVTGIAPPPPPPAEAVAPPPPSPDAPPPARRHLEASHPRREGEDYDLECARRGLRDQRRRRRRVQPGVRRRRRGDGAAGGQSVVRLPIHFGNARRGDRRPGAVEPEADDRDVRRHPLVQHAALLVRAPHGRDATRRTPPARSSPRPTRAHTLPRPWPTLYRYLDSTFCARFHALKEHVDDPAMIEVRTHRHLLPFAAIVAFEGCQLLCSRGRCWKGATGAIRRNFVAVF